MKLFEKESMKIKVDASAIYGGNNSDVNYSDSKRDGARGYDIAVNSLIDTVDSSQSLDKPSNP